MPVPFLLSLAVGIATSFIGYLLLPRAKAERPPSVEDLPEPTAEAGRPIPVSFGSVTISGLNILWYGDVEVQDREVRQGKK